MIKRRHVLQLSAGLLAFPALQVSAATPDISAAAPDILILDVRAKESQAALRRFASVIGTVKLVVCAASNSAREVLACAESGVHGYVSRDASQAELIAMLRNVMRGDGGEPRAMPMSRLAARAVASREEGRAAPVLTARERQVLARIDRGLTNKEIASDLHIEVATVKNHVHSLLSKMHVRSRAQAAAKLNGDTTVL